MVAVLAGYALAQPGVQAQDEALPFARGDSVMMVFEVGSGKECIVADIKGFFVKCENAVAAAKGREYWLNVQNAVSVMKMPR
jgi:hypothetical protein